MNKFLTLLLPLKFSEEGNTTPKYQNLVKFEDFWCFFYENGLKVQIFFITIAAILDMAAILNSAIMNFFM